MLVCQTKTITCCCYRPMPAKKDFVFVLLLLFKFCSTGTKIRCVYIYIYTYSQYPLTHQNHSVDAFSHFHSIKRLRNIWHQISPWYAEGCPFHFSHLLTNWSFFVDDLPSMLEMQYAQLALSASFNLPPPPEWTKLEQESIIYIYIYCTHSAQRPNSRLPSLSPSLRPAGFHDLGA